MQIITYLEKKIIWMDDYTLDSSVEFSVYVLWSPKTRTDGVRILDAVALPPSAIFFYKVSHVSFVIQTCILFLRIIV